MTKTYEMNVLRRHFLIGAVAGLCGAMVMLGDVRASRAGGGGGGGSEGGNPRSALLTPEARTKLKKLRDTMKKLEDDIKRGKKRPLTHDEKMYFMGLLEMWAQYKETPEFQDALWAVYDAGNATGPR